MIKMVTNLEMQQFEQNAVGEDRTAYKVTGKEMQQFDTAWELAEKIGNKKDIFQKEKGLKAYPAYDALEELCQINATSIRKTISGTNKVTRKFLYKFTIGLRMSLDEANEYFALCGGELYEKNKEDYICMRAIEDGDTIFEFIEQFEKYTDMKIALR